ncbi:MAG: TonB-dependent receptor [Caulobacteraceae bacterium]
MRVRIALGVAGWAAAICVHGAHAAAAAPGDAAATPLSEVQIVARPAATAALGRTVSGGQLQAPGQLDLQGGLARSLPGAVIADTQGNPFTQDLQLRGFDASPTSGRPQGLAVQQNGARLNEPFGDTVNWDLIPQVAIAGADLQTQNPAFGLNALAGALSLRMKSGFDGDRSLTVRGGSFGRAFGAAEASRRFGDTAVYVAVEGGQDGGWRLHSPSQIARAYGDLAWKGDKAEARLSISGADNRLTAVGPTPVDLLARDRRAVYTWPQTTHNASALASASGRWQVSPDWSLSANLYLRRFDQAHVDGNDGDFEGCSSSKANPLFSTLCLQDDAFPRAIRPAAANFQVQSLAGVPVPCPPAAGGGRPCSGLAYGTIDRARTGWTLWGSGVEATRAAPIGRLDNSLTLGLGATMARARFSSDSELGVINADLSVTPSAGVPGTGQLIRTAGALAYTPVAVTADIDTQGAYVSDTLSITRQWSLTLAGRWNGEDIRLADLTGTSPGLNGGHRFQRFDPAVTIAYMAAPGIRLYGGYSEANRAPTPLELGCSDPTRPCLLEDALVADPPLKQVVARSWEAGVKADRLLGGRLSLSADAFTIDSDDDILALPSVLIGRGSYANVPLTRRRGLEIEAAFRQGPVSAFANYGLVDATYQFAGALPSPNSPFADADGLVAIRPGDRIGGIAPQTLKAGLYVQASRALSLGAEATAVAAQPLAGDEHGQDASLPGYATVNLHGSYALGRASLFLKVDNLLDSRAASFGAYFGTDSLASAPGAPSITSARTLVPLQPRAVEIGFSLRW